MNSNIHVHEILTQSKLVQPIFYQLSEKQHLIKVCCLYFQCGIFIPKKKIKGSVKEHTVKELYEWGEAVCIYCFQPQSTQKWEMAYKAKYVFHSHA